MGSIEGSCKREETIPCYNFRMSNNLSNVFNIYCDETRVENQNSRKMVIGAIIIPRLKKKKVIYQLQSLKKTYSFHQEIKWNKVGNKYHKFYTKIIDLFLNSNEIQFRCIVVDKSLINYDLYHKGDEELAFFKFYYLLLSPVFQNSYSYYVFLDKKPTRDKNRARALKSYLNSYTLLKKQECKVIHLQSYQSDENEMIQLSDFFTGLIGKSVNSSIDLSTKQKIVDYFLEQGKVKMSFKKFSGEEKINIFNWRPQL